MQWAEAYVDRTGVLDLLSKGWHHVTIDTFRHRMNDEGLRVSRALQKFLVEEIGFAPKACLVGMSWGGFFSTRYAAAFPECVGKIYLDAPLMNFDGFAKVGGTPTENAARIGPWANMPPADGNWSTDSRMPVNMADRLAKAGIPILLLYGGQDATVPPAKNCELFAEKFKAAGGKIDIRHRALYGHHPHGEDPDKTSSIVFFFEAKK
jgi:pimeloyl-ACP methyl ester carboxylesterase